MAVTRKFNVYNLPGDALDALVEWRLNDPGLVVKPGPCIEWPHLLELDFSEPEEQQHMQRQFNIELRVDYADNDKNETMKTALQRAARHIMATAALLADGVKPAIAIYSDDFFSGHEEIALIEDTIAQGIALVGGAEDEVSPEMAALAQSMKQG